ncbi:MAG: hypothetical protein MR671_10305 [Clostridiales bacterium]|jgi:hypothetical protein|uniref:hypothetical protein n=1 Tax=Chordicoccus furentiruminis TaxID=2709410 RepID=UPI0023A7CB51|nr:hypothetical protein [Chordicoccus furentiruminis]MCI6174630.1 hypothetical protein [Clostridiales bacterium]
MIPVSIEDADRILRGKLIEICGFGRGVQIGNAVVPGILRDFAHMLRAADGGGAQETYRTDDGRAVIRLAGRMEERRPRITSIEVSGKEREER